MPNGTTARGRVGFLHGPGARFWPACERRATILALSPPILAALVFGTGILAGALNTVAGGGSLLTLPVFLMLVGLPAPVANGTSRVAVLVQSLTAAVAYRRGNVGGARFALRIAPVVCAGSLVGAWLATLLPAAPLQRVMGVVFLLCVPVVLLSHRVAAGTRQEPRAVHPVLLVGGALVVGLYSGFLQAAVGIPILLLLVWGLGMDAVAANHAKVLIIAASMAVALAVFARAGQVDLLYGGIAAGGQAIGALLGARLVIRRGLVVIRWGLAFAVTVSAVEMLR